MEKFKINHDIDQQKNGFMDLLSVWSRGLLHAISVNMYNILFDYRMIIYSYPIIERVGFLPCSFSPLS